MLSLECFEMEARSTPVHHHQRDGDPHPARNRLQKKILDEEYELRDLPQGKAISCWWLTIPVFCYLAVITGGVLSSISVGDVTASFDGNCVFYANITMKGLDLLQNGSKLLMRENVQINQWGDMDTCLFPEYTSVACVMYAGVLLVMVLQCGRGGGKSAFRGRGIAESWRIVPIAFVFNLIFLILSSIIFGNIQNGFSTFCDGMSQIGSSRSLGNVSSCAQVLQYAFPWDKYNTNLYKEYVLAKAGAYLQLFGSLLALLTIMVRCCIPADFIVYRRRRIMITPGIQSSSYEEHRIGNEPSTSSGHHRDRDSRHFYREGADSIDGRRQTKTSTTVDCHSEAVPDLTRGDDYNDDAFFPVPEGTTSDDTESIHSARSDANLVPEVRIASGSGSSSAKIKIIEKSSK